MSYAIGRAIIQVIGPEESSKLFLQVVAASLCRLTSVFLDEFQKFEPQLTNCCLAFLERLEAPLLSGLAGSSCRPIRVDKNPLLLCHLLQFSESFGASFLIRGVRLRLSHAAKLFDDFALNGVPGGALLVEFIENGARDPGLADAGLVVSTV